MPRNRPVKAFLRALGLRLYDAELDSQRDEVEQRPLLESKANRSLELCSQLYIATGGSTRDWVLQDCAVDARFFVGFPINEHCESVPAQSSRAMSTLEEMVSSNKRLA